MKKTIYKIFISIVIEGAEERDVLVVDIIDIEVAGFGVAYTMKVSLNGKEI